MTVPEMERSVVSAFGSSPKATDSSAKRGKGLS
jgi:hypothetical protein